MALVAGGGIVNEERGWYYKNYCNANFTVKMPADLSTNNREMSSININRIKQSQLVRLNGAIVKCVTNEIMPINWQLFDFYLFGKIEITKPVESYVICAISKSAENEESYAYLLNIKDGCLKSIATISYGYYISSDDYGAMYTAINSGTLSLFESICRIDDICCDNGEEIPWYITLRLWLSKIFSKSRMPYSHVLTLTLDEDGLLHENH